MPPIAAYFGGNGMRVMKDMKRKHGEKAGERMFYATAAKKKQKPSGHFSGVKPKKEC